MVLICNFTYFTANGGEKLMLRRMLEKTSRPSEWSTTSSSSVSKSISEHELRLFFKLFLTLVINNFDLLRCLIFPLNSATRRRKENFDAGAGWQVAGEKFDGFQLRLPPGPDLFHGRGLGEEQPAEPQRHRFQQQRHQLQSW